MSVAAWDGFLNDQSNWPAASRIGNATGATTARDTLETINKFFENNLNVSETSRKLYVHRNTLVYRLEKIKKITGLDLREFDHAIVFKVAMMVKKYLDTQNTSKY